MDARTGTRQWSWPKRIIAVLLLVVGLLLGAGGIWLATLGGSLYYVLAGLTCLAVAFGLWRGSAWSGWLFAAFLLATLIWSWFEAGLDFWALMPRVIGPAVVGIFVALVMRGGARWAVVASVVAIAIVQAVALNAGSPEKMLAVASPETIPAGPDSADWLHYGNNQGGSRFSPLAQITPANVDQLEKIWTFHVGPSPDSVPAMLEATPIAADGNLYFCVGHNDVIALDAATGKQKWRFDARLDPRGAVTLACRGVARYSDMKNEASGEAANASPAAGAATPAPVAAEASAKPACTTRIIAATLDARLIALDALTGKPCADFGENGQVDLTEGMGQVDKGYYYVTSAPAIVRGKIVIGGWVTDGQKTEEPSGVIRGFDVHTGKLAWAWDMGAPDRRGLPPEGEHYTRGTPNSWAPISADEELGLVYLPTGNATPDYFGGHRKPEWEKYSSSVVAIDAETGELRWAFQTTHHDLWDYDVASQPTLVDIEMDGKTVPALLQGTKRGQLFALDRRTGKPIRAVEERAVPTDTVPEDFASPTQPFSVGMPSFAGPDLRERDMWGITPIDQMVCRIMFKSARYKGPLTPITLDWTIVYPGYVGGMNWGSVTVDPVRQLAFVNSQRFAMRNRLMTREEANERGLSAAKPGISHFNGGAAPQEGVPYAADISPFMSPLGVPCQEPPFAMISAVDLKTGKLRWTRPLGTAETAGPLGIGSGVGIELGAPMSGGNIATGGGLTFVAASSDGYFRAFDSRTGKELWRSKLPAAGMATPMTYKLPGGRQVVVVAAGGSPIFGGISDTIVAYALKQ